MTPRKKTTTSKSVQKPAVEELEEELCRKAAIEDSLRMLLKAEGTDCKITCQGYEWNVHSLIVCAKSEYLARAFNGRFAEGTSKNLDWSNENPHAIESFLIYLYTNHYPNWVSYEMKGLLPDAPDGSGDVGLSSQPARSPDAAVDLSQPGPKEACVNKYRLQTRPSEDCWKDIIALWKFSERYGCKKLQHFAASRLRAVLNASLGNKHFVPIMESMWELEGEGAPDLQDMVVDASYKNISQLLEDDEFRQILNRADDLGWCIIAEMLRFQKGA